MNYAPRPYQADAINAAREHVKAGLRRVLIQAPTGTGKMVVAATIMQLAVRLGSVVLFCAHRRELIEQCGEKLEALGVHHARVLPGEYPSGLERAYVGTIQSFTARQRRGSLNVEAVNVIVVDEAHHVTSKNTYQKLLAEYPNATVIGLTATPCRTDGQGLGNVFDALVQSITYSAAFEAGHLVRPKYFAPHTPDLAGVRTIAGDYDEAELEGVMNQPKLVGDIVEHYARHASDRKGIVFATRVRHSMALADAFNAAGIPAAHLDGTTPLEDRQAILADLRSGAIQVMTNVAVATEGLDIPDVGAVVIARPTKSVVLHLQTVGRALRPSPGKTDCIVLDHSGNVLELGPVEAYETWTLDTTKGANARKKKREARPITCESCSTVFAASLTCPACGLKHESTKYARDVDVLAGDLAEFKAGVSRKLEVTVETKRQWFAELLWVARSKGYKPGWASRKYRDKFGVWPDRVQGVQPSVPGAEVLAFVRTEQRKWAREREAERLREEAAAVPVVEVIAPPRAPVKPLPTILDSIPDFEPLVRRGHTGSRMTWGTS